MVVAELVRDVLLGWRTDNGIDTACAECAGNLRELGSQSADAGVDEQALARREPGNCGEGEMGSDTLRWYERVGILPTVRRGSSGRRQYGPQERDLVLLLTSLRDTGISTSKMKTFVQLLMEGAASHGRRIDLLERARELLKERRRKIDQAQAALEAKIQHYQELIAAGLDCDGAPVADDIRALQAARS